MNDYKRSDSNAENNHRLQLVPMEPRILLSADALALVGLPGVDPKNAVEEKESFIQLQTPVNSGDHVWDFIPHQNDEDMTGSLELQPLESSHTEVIFIDSSIPKAESLINEITRSNASSELFIYMIDYENSGVDQISSALENHHQLLAIHIISHGENGELALGNEGLNIEVLNQKQNTISHWSNALNENGDILLYGCNVAQGEKGFDFINHLSDLTGVDIGASSDSTGHSSLEGNWDLEYQTGLLNYNLQLNELNFENWEYLLATPTKNGSHILVNSVTGGDQENVDIAVHSDGSFVAVWGSSNPSGTDSNIMMQRFDAASTPLGGETQVNINSVGFQDNPSIGMSVFGDYVISWESSNGGNSDILARVFNADGSAKVFNQSSDIIVDNHLGIQSNPDVAMDVSGRFAVTWQGERGDLGDTSGIFAQRFNSVGGVAGSAFIVNDTFQNNNQVMPKIAMDFDGDFIISFTDGHTGMDRISAQLFDWQGATSLIGSGNFVVNDEVGIARFSSVAMDLIGNFVVVWEEGNIDGDNSGVFMRRYDAIGTELNLNPVLVNTETSNRQGEPSVSMSSTGEFLVTWTSTGQDSDGGGVFAQLYTNLGASDGNEFQVNTYVLGEQINSAVGLNNGHIVVAWEGQGLEDLTGVYGQRLGAGFPNLTTFASALAQTIEETEVEIVLADFMAQGDESDPDGSIDSFIIKSISSGSLKIGSSSILATPWALGSNDRVNGSLHAYWTPALNAYGTVEAFRVVVRDNDGKESSTPIAAQVDITGVNDSPLGTIVIDNGVPLQGDSLSFSNGISDFDGISGLFNYQWQRNGVDILGENGTSYTTGQEDVGAQIRVIARYTDLGGTLETVISAETAPVIDVNDLPVGSVSIDNLIPQEDDSLTATANITDLDGISGPIGFQWLRDGIPIVGATGLNYTVIQEDVGAMIRVAITYIDDGGFQNSLDSISTAQVQNINDTPLGSVNIDNLTPKQGDLLSSNHSITDLDGISNPFNYQWQRNGLDIMGATQNTYLLTQEDVGFNIQLRVSYIDDYNQNESLTSLSTAHVLNVNDSPVGDVQISPVNARVGEMIQAVQNFTDLDGISGPLMYQWQRDGIDINGQTNQDYQVQLEDEGKKLRVLLQYIDDFGKLESLLSDFVEIPETLMSDTLIVPTEGPKRETVLMVKFDSLNLLDSKQTSDDGTNRLIKDTISYGPIDALSLLTFQEKNIEVSQEQEDIIESNFIENTFNNTINREESSSGTYFENSYQKTISILRENIMINWDTPNSLISQGSYPSFNINGPLVEQYDVLRNQYQVSLKEEQKTLMYSTGLSSGLSIGYLAWWLKSEPIFNGHGALLAENSQFFKRNPMYKWLWRAR